MIAPSASDHALPDVSPETSIGANTCVWHFAVVLAEVVTGTDQPDDAVCVGNPARLLP